MIDHLGIHPWGAVALVSYVPDPMRSFLAKMRQLFSGSDDPQPHITILPPRTLRQPIQHASETIRGILDRFDGFDVELSNVRHFPETSFIYLDIREGNRAIREVHTALNAGNLQDVERFEFRPHLTLGGPYKPLELEKVKAQAALAWRQRDVPSRVPIRSVVCLWMPPYGNCQDWRPVWSYNLGHSRPAQPQHLPATGLTTRTY
jgi:2'-5' RNA ligase